MKYPAAVLFIAILLSSCSPVPNHSAVSQTGEVSEDTTVVLSGKKPPVDVQLVLLDQSAVIGDDVPVSLTVTPRVDISAAVVFFRAEGGIELLVDTTSTLEAVTAGQAQTVTATVRLKGGKGILTGGVRMNARNGERPFSRLARLHVLVYEESVYAAGSFTEARLDSLEQSRRAGKTSEAAYKEALQRILSSQGETQVVRSEVEKKTSIGSHRLEPLISLSAAADTLNLTNDDFQAITLPFAFPFGSDAHTFIFVSSNGFISFTEGSTNPIESAESLLTGPSRIAGLWDDLNPEAGGRIYTEEVVDEFGAPEFNIAYLDVAEVGTGAAATFTIVLRPNGTFAVSYGSVGVRDGLVGVSVGYGVPDPSEVDLSVALQPIEGDGHGTSYEFFDTPFDLAGTILDFDAIIFPDPVPKAEITVSGTVRWSDSNGNLHPVRNAPVEVWDEDVVSDDSLGTSTTDDTGAYSIVVPNQLTDRIDVYIKAFARSTGFDVVLVGNVNAPASSRTFTYNVRSAPALDLNADVTINLDIPNTTEAGNAFSVADAMVMASRYMNDLTGSFLPLIPVQFPGPGDASFFRAAPLPNILSVLLLDRYDWDVLHHEYGHYVSFVFDLDNGLGLRHGSGVNMGEPPPGDFRYGRGNGYRLAWSESWPTYFGTSLQTERNGATFGIPFVGDARYRDTEDSDIDDDLEFQTGGDSMGEDEEYGVQRTLWDLYDSDPDDRDQVIMGDVALWNALSGASPDILSDAWNAITGGMSMADKSFYGGLFADHRVAPDPTRPDDETVIPPDGGDVEFCVRSNGGGPSNRNSNFQFFFFTEDLGTELWRSGTLAAAQPVASIVCFEPPPEAFRDFIFRNDSRVSWLATGWNPTAPASGVYVSPYSRVIAGDIDVAFAIDDTGSMEEEIGGVRAALLSHLATYPADADTVFQLTTFKDNVTSRPPTSDLALVQNQVSGLYASGGGDCPEASIEAIDAMIDQVDDGGRIFLATDASPHPWVNVRATISRLRARGIRVDVILSGDCEPSAAESKVTTVSSNAPATKVARHEQTQKKIVEYPVVRTGILVPSGVAADTLILFDDYFVEVMLPFDFPFGGLSYSTVFVGSNGYVTFGEGRTDLSGYGEFFASGPRRIAGLFRDLDPSLGGTVTVAEESGEFRILFDSVPRYGGGAFVTFTVVLRSDGSFAVDYGDISIADGLAGASVGNVGDPGAVDLSGLAQPIDLNTDGVVYEVFTGDVDLANQRLEYAPVTFTPPRVFSAIEGFSLIARETAGIFAYVPEINSGGASDRQRFENAAFNIVQGGLHQSIALAAPATVPAGSRVNVTLTGASTNFQPNTVVSVAGGGVNVTSTSVQSPISLTANLLIDASAELSFRDVLAITDLGGGVVDTARGLGALQVVAAITSPVILGITPSAVPAGQSAQVAVDALNTNFDATSVLELGSGITVVSVEAKSGTELLADINVSVSAPIGFRDVRVTTGLETASENVVGPFFVEEAVAESEARLLSVLPASGAPGSSKTISISAENTVFVEGLSVVSFSGSGVDAVTTSVTSPTSLTADIVIAETAERGFRDVRVTTGAEVVAMLDAFFVTELSPTAVSLVAPDDASVLLTLNPTLEWTPSTLADTYEVQVANDAAFSSIVMSENPAITSLTTSNLIAGETYYWRVRAVNTAGESDWSETRSFAIDASAVDIVGTPDDLPTMFAVKQNYPNPFNPSTRISYDLPRLAEATLTTFDVLGREVRALFLGTQPAGTYEISFDASELPSGIYFYRFQAGDFVETRQMIVVK